MSVPHHEPADEESMRRFIEQTMNIAPVRFPNGRLCREDDGDLSYAIASDVSNGVVRIVFPKPVTWIGLDIKSAEQLRDAIDSKIHDLRRSVET